MEFVAEVNRENAKVLPAMPTPSSPLEGADPNRTFIVERNKGGFFKPTIYVIKPLLDESTADGPQGPTVSTLWARMHVGQKNQYTISGDIADLSKPRRERSNKFVGKVKVDYPGRVYIGWTQRATDDSRAHLVTVVYDHERMASVDFKMEVGLPLTPTPSFHDDFMLIYRDGTQNLSKADKILVLVQGDDSRNMAELESLKSLNGTAAMVSTKNFSLIKSKAIRANMYVESKPVSGEAESPTDKAPDDGAAEVETQPFMNFGKLSENTFSCRFREPIDVATAFMIILSRFDTTQKYE